MSKIIDTAKKVVLTGELKHYIDLNTDLGQTQDKPFFEKDDYKLLNYMSSVNIPCCVHDGNPREIIDYIGQAKDYHCTVGAHIGYPDPANFGYSHMSIDDEDLAAWIRVQVGSFQGLIKVHDLQIEHVRPHGALYGDFLNDYRRAKVVAETLYSINPWMILLAPAGPVLNKVVEEVGIRVAPEVYLGKRYNSDGLLLKEQFHEELNLQGVVDQAKQLLNDNTLTSVDGQKVQVEFQSLHLSPKLAEANDIAEEVYKLLGQPVAPPVAAIGKSGWA